MVQQQHLKEFKVSYQSDGVWIRYPDGQSFDYDTSEQKAREFAVEYPNTRVRMSSVGIDGEATFEVAYEFFDQHPNPIHDGKEGLYVSYGQGWSPYVE